MVFFITDFSHFETVSSVRESRKMAAVTHVIFDVDGLIVGEISTDLY